MQKHTNQSDLAIHPSVRRKWAGFLPWLLAGVGLLLLRLVASPPHVEATVPGVGDLGNSTLAEDVALGDLDGDGDLDFIIGRRDQRNEVYLNDGGIQGGIPGTFPSGIPFGSEDNTYSTGMGDLDGDGDLDLVVGNGDQQNLVYLNQGAGVFSSSVSFGSSDDTRSLDLGDLDGDGDFDLVVGGLGQLNLVYLNDGGLQGGAPGTFPTGTFFGDAYHSTTFAMVLGDLDSDSDLDLVTGNFYQENVVYLNDGTGVFSSGVPFGGSDGTIALALGDLNGDGTLDLVVGNDTDQGRVYLNDGTGVFSSSVALGNLSDWARSTMLGDVDDDGDLDVLVVTGASQQNLVYLNDGTGAFSAASPFGSSSDWGRGMALADLDGDASIDLLVGNQIQQGLVYPNDGTSRFSAGTFFGDVDSTFRVVLGDLDGDGALDLVVGNLDYESKVYLNDGTGAFSSATPFDFSETTHDVGLGDLDGDSDLDIVVGNWNEQNLVYLNDGGIQGGIPGTFPSGTPFGSSDKTASVGIGDLNGDRALDLVVGNWDGQNLVYLNDGSGVFSSGVPFGGPDNTESVALGDVSGDGALDLAVGNWEGQNLVYLNDGAGNFSSSGVPIGGPDITFDLAVGDVSGDGYLDIVVSNWEQHSLVYLNDGTGAFPTGTAFGGPRGGYSVGLEDLDGDGDLDIVTGNSGQNLVYLNDGSGQFGWSPRTREFGTGADLTRSVAAGDVNGDGTLDLVAGNDFGQNAVYLNRSRMSERLSNNLPYLEVTRPGSAADADFYSTPEILDNLTIPITYTLFDSEGDPVGHIAAYYSLDGGGQWLPAVCTDTQTANLSTSLPVHHASGNTFPITISAASNPVTSTLIVFGDQAVADLGVWLDITHTNDSDLDVYLESPSGTRVELFTGVGGFGDGFFGTVLDDEAATPITSGTAPFTRTYQPEGNLADFDGEMAIGVWTLWITDTAPISGDGAILSWGINLDAGDGTHVFTWDTFASGVFGQSDNAVFRLDAYPQPVHTGITGTYRYTNSTPGPYQWPYAAATTFPFRVRGTQVRVYSETVAPGNEVVGALVYRLPVGQSHGAEPLGGMQKPFRTDVHGYLQGHGRVDINDRLVALLPITATESYTLYHTSAAPVTAGLDAYPVASPGVQTLTVSFTDPLILFSLDVSLEWDARNDDEFMSRLQFDLQRASEILYDWMNGRAALGRVRVFHDRERWLDAHIRVYGSNRLRPSAAQGGIVGTVITDPLVSTVVYAPGQVYMGATWNRYGDAGSGLGEDWPRALAHELGHYALYLEDNYLGLDEDGLLIPIEGCPGAMSDPYREDYPYDEFHFQEDWLPACERTLSHQSTGRSDWETIGTLYQWLSGTIGITNAGPSGLPLEVTQVEVVEPVTPSTALENPVFYLSQGGYRVQPGRGARAFLFQRNADSESRRLIDLGRPRLDQVLARGARPGDRVCVYELAAERLGCETVAAGDEQLELATVADWQPEVIVSPVTSRTIGITVTNVPAGLPVWARLFPVTDPATGPISLTETTGRYTAIFNTDEPALEGYVQVWVDEADPRREIATDYAMGGNPGHVRGGPTGVRGRPGHVRGGPAPVISSDGQAILFGDLDFADGEFVVLQAATFVPSPPPWATVVGQAYRLSASASAPDMGGASISFGYLGSEVPPGEETWLRVHFWNGSSWEQLPTHLNTYYNNASVPVRGEGLYALMSSIEIPLYGTGWNMFAYPVQATRPVSEALLSVSGYYTTVYGYEVQDAADPWKVYDVTAPEWVNDLHVLEFGRGYWVQVSETITLMLKGEPDAALAVADNLQSPPATYYGEVEAGPSFIPVTGMEVSAWIGENLCGRGTTLEASDRIVYSVNVSADGPGEVTGCGALGREVRFRIGLQEMVPSVAWDNNRLWEFSLRPIHRVYLPLVKFQGS